MVLSLMYRLFSERRDMLRKIGPAGPVNGCRFRRISIACRGSGTKCAGVRLSRFCHSRSFIFSGGQRHSSSSRWMSSHSAKRNWPGRWKITGANRSAQRVMKAPL
ncbi:hypothetical protein D3C86_1586260 [compost metagenome]